jgi:hypothetical protein
MPKGGEGLESYGTTAAYGESRSDKFSAGDGSVVAKLDS